MVSPSLDVAQKGGRTVHVGLAGARRDEAFIESSNEGLAIAGTFDIASTTAAGRITGSDACSLERGFSTGDGQGMDSMRVDIRNMPELESRLVREGQRRWREGPSS